MSDGGLTVVGPAYGPVVRPERVVELPAAGEPHAVVVLPDGDTCVVSAENGGELYRVSLGTGAVETLRGGHDMPVNDLAWADGGRLLLSASDDSTVRVWDTARWRVTAVLEGHEGFVRSVAGAGRRAVSGGEDRTVRVWDVRTGRQLALFEDHGESVDEVAISADGRRAASSTRDNGMRLWDLAAPDGPRLERQLYGATSEVHYIPGGFLGSSAYVPLGVNDSGVGHHNAPGALLFGPDGDLFSSDEEIIRWDAAAGKERWRAAPHSIGAHALALHPRLPLLVSATIFGIRVLDLSGAAAPRRVAALAVGEETAAALAFTRDGRLVSVHGDHTLRVWPALGGTDRWEGAGPRHTATVAGLTCDPDGRLAATHCNDRTLMLWDLATGRPLAALDDHARAVTEAVALARDPLFLSGGRLVALHDSRRIHLWETGPDRVGAVRTLEPEEGESADFTSIVQVQAVDQETVLVESYGRPLELWPVDGGPRRTFQGAAGVRMRAAVGSPDGRWVLTLSMLERNHPLLADDPKTREATGVLGRPALQCWDRTTGRLAWTRYTTGTDTWPVGQRVVVRADGTVLTAVREPGPGLSLLVLDAATGGELRRVPMPETSCDQAPREEPDGSLLFTGQEDRRLRVWRLAPDADRPVPVVTTGPARTTLLVPGRPLLLQRAHEEVTLHALDADATELARTRLPAPVYQWALSPTGHHAVLADQTGAVHVLHIA